jgi:hypothetical protein
VDILGSRIQCQLLLPGLTPDVAHHVGQKAKRDDEERGFA